MHPTQHKTAGTMNGPELRQATRADSDEMLALLRSVCTEGNALPFIDGLDQQMIESQWLRATGCVIACSSDGLLGMYRYGPNMPGRGAHVATATFLVSQKARGQGVGRALVAHCIEAARTTGFRAMQFNQVISSNAAALALYRRMGFKEVGKIPAAFDHVQFGYIDAYIMYRTL